MQIRTDIKYVTLLSRCTLRWFDLTVGDALYIVLLKVLWRLDMSPVYSRNIACMPRYTFLLPFICVTSSGLSFILIFHTLIFDFSFLPFHLFHHCLILPPSWQKKLSLLHLLPVSNFFVIRDTLSAILFHAWVVNANTENSFIKTYFVKVSPRWKQHRQ